MNGEACSANKFMKKIIALLIFIILVLLFSIIFMHFKYVSNDEAFVDNNKKIIIKDKETGHKKENSQISQIIMPHHLFATIEINEFLKDFSNRNSKFDRIILISPNHFNAGNSAIITRKSDFRIGDKVFKANESTVKKIINNSDAKVENSAFTFEHGIFNLMPILNDYYKDIPITPIILKRGINNGKLSSLSKAILNLDGTTLLVYSIDFSHTLDRNFSYIHDLKSQEVLRELDEQNVEKLDIDCPDCLKVGFEIAKSVNQKSFKTFKRTSAAEIANNDFPGENTSYVLGEFTKEEQLLDKNSIFMFFGGDVMLDRQIRIYSRERGMNDYFDDIDRLFWSWDAVIFNLEGIIGERKSLSLGMPMENPNHFKFTFDKKDFFDLAKSIKSPLIVNDGNNHSLNFGHDGFRHSREILKRNNFDYFGDIAGESNETLRKEINGRKISFVSYNSFNGNGLDNTIEKIKSEKKDGYDVIVYTHWGIEYKKDISKELQDISHKFVDAGAKMIIGSHPHVAEPIEIYKNSIIFYSFGNLIFDQFFSPDVVERMVAGCKFSNTDITCAISPLEHKVSDGLVFENNKKRKNFFKWLSANSIVNTSQKESLKKGILTLKFKS